MAAGLIIRATILDFQPSVTMAPVSDSGVESAALLRRQALTGASGPGALVKNVKVFGIACFACLGGLVYGYNQGVISGILTMPSFSRHMGDWVQDQTKKGWLTSIFELGAWFGCLYSGFLAETLSRKRAIQFNVLIFVVGVIVQYLSIASGFLHSWRALRYWSSRWSYVGQRSQLQRRSRTPRSAR